jgi:prolyl oligopeptidase
LTARSSSCCYHGDTVPIPRCQSVFPVAAVLPAFGLLACAASDQGAGPPLSATAPAPVAVQSAAPPASAARQPGEPGAGGLIYPATRKGGGAEVLHGVAVPDPYRWLEDEKSPEVKAWMAAQDQLARAELAKLPGRDAIAARLRELFYVDALGVPHHYGNRYFYSRRHADKEKAIVYWKEGKKGQDKVLLDPNTWSADGSSSLGGWSVSWDGKTVAYTMKKNNSDEATMYVIDVASGKQSTVDVIEGAKYAHAAWTPSGDGFYYTLLPTDKAIPTADRPGFAEVRFHKLGDDPRSDRLVRERTGDAKMFVSAELSRDGRWLVCTVQRGWSATDVYFQDLHDRKAPGVWRPLAVGKDAIYSVTAWKGQFYVHTNEGASRWKVMRVDPAHPGRDRWVDLVAEHKDATLESISIVGGKLSLGYLRDVVSLLELRELDGSKPRAVKLPAVGSASVLIGQPDEDEAYFVFTSFTYPSEIHEVSVKKNEPRLFSRVKVPVDPSKYAVEQVFFTSKDGTRVPMFIVRPLDLKRDGSAPVLLTGYGGFQAAMTPSFRSSIYPWLERGGVFAVPNLRGGSEYGEEWHRGGMKHNKQNVFDDFIAAAEFLVREGYTRPSKLVIQGASNGGLLVGAAMVQRPELFRVVLCGVPLLDMVRYHLFGSGKTWIEEYGSAEDAADFKALFAYSPYHHVQAGTKYPSMLMLSADSDDRVDPMHARKFAALIQERSTGGPALLRIERNAGHGGADLIKAAVEKGADEMAFALSQIE